jgi:hypothetical protein
MKWDTKQPCESCPYRRDSKLKFWCESEFESLLANDASPILGHMFGCHGTRKNENPSICAGWLLDQIDRGLPSIMLRMSIIHSEEAVKLLDEVTDGGYELYSSIEEMVRANYPALLRRKKLQPKTPLTWPVK